MYSRGNYPIVKGLGLTLPSIQTKIGTLKPEGLCMRFYAGSLMAGLLLGGLVLISHMRTAIIPIIDLVTRGA